MLMEFNTHTYMHTVYEHLVYTEHCAKHSTTVAHSIPATALGGRHYNDLTTQTNLRHREAIYPGLYDEGEDKPGPKDHPMSKSTQLTPRTGPSPSCPSSQAPITLPPCPIPSLLGALFIPDWTALPLPTTLHTFYN